MTRDQAKDILALYRPRTGDERDPDFTDALIHAWMIDGSSATPSGLSIL